MLASRLNNGAPHAGKISPAATPAAAPLAPAPSENLGVAPAPPIARSDKTDPLKLYRAAYEGLRAGHHDEAARGFRDFLKRFPSHDLADNAQYWLGECFYDRKLYVEAAPEFRAVVSRYPLGNKAPDALLKLGYCLLALGDGQQGRAALNELIEHYPKTEAWQLARKKLDELGGPEKKM